MKKLIFSIVITFTLQFVYSQEVYFAVGKNFTTYEYKNSSGASNPNLKSGTGNFFELGFINPLGDGKFAYSAGLALNEYNNVGGNSATSYSWNTQYLGAQGGFMYSIFEDKDFDLIPKFGLNM